MIALIQRVLNAKVVIEQTVVGEIQHGVLALIGIEKTDDTTNVQRMLKKLLGYRLFADAKQRMNLSLTSIQGGLLLAPQFTLVANTKKGLKPSFSSAASPRHGEMLFNALVCSAQQTYQHVQSGQFGANMQIHLVNDGPVTFWLNA